MDFGIASEVAITEKYTMTVPEAAVYFGIGQKKLGGSVRIIRLTALQSTAETDI